jgi:ABC-type transport system substrate-binding protein
MGADIANNKELSPSGPSVELLVDGQPPKVEIIDEHTIRYSWDKPNPYFMESQACAAPAATNLIPAKAGLGESDLQSRYLSMRD